MTKHIVWIAAFALLLAPSGAFAAPVTYTAGIAPVDGSIFNGGSPVVFQFTGLTPSQGATGSLRIITRGDVDGGAGSDEELIPTVDPSGANATLADVYTGVPASLIVPGSAEATTLFGTAPFNNDPIEPFAAWGNNKATNGQVDSDDVIGDETLPIPGALLKTITLDGVVDLSLAFDTSLNGINVLEDSDFVLATLTYDATIVVVNIPEPSTLFSALLAAMSLGLWRRRRR